METGNLLQPWRDQHISPCFLPSKHCKLTHGGMGSQKLGSLFSYLLLEGRAAVEQGLCLCKDIWKCLAVLEIRNPHFLSPVPYILERVFSLPASEQRLVPELAVQVEVVSDHLWCCFLPPQPCMWDHVVIRAAEEVPRMLTGAYSQYQSPEGPSHSLVLSRDLGAYACI